MEPPGGRDSRFQLGYSMNLLSGESPPEIYGTPLGGRPSTSLQQLSPRHTMVSSNQCGGGGGGNRGGLNLKSSDVCYDERGMTTQHGMGGFESGNVNDIHDEPYNSLQSKKSPPSNGKKTKGRVKIKMEYIENKLRRYTTFSKRKTGIMKKAYELSTLTGTQVMLLVASETGHVYTFATRKLQPMITSEAGKALIQTCLNSPDPPVGSAGGDQRMSATGFEETELTYNISDEDSKEDGYDLSEGEEFDDDGSDDEEEPPKKVFLQSESNGPPFRSHSPPSNKSSDSSSSEYSKKPTDNNNKIKLSSKISSIKSDEDSEKSSIIDQIKQINNALIQSNKAKTHQHQPQSLVTNTSSSPSPPISQSSSLSSSVVLSSSSTSTILQNTPSFQLTSSMQNPIQSQVVVQLSDNIKAVPLIIQTGTGMAFASVSDGMILGVIQGSESKFVAMPLNSVVTAGSIIESSADSCSDEEMNGTDQEPLSVFVTPDHEVFNTISPPSSPRIDPKNNSKRQISPSSSSSSAKSNNSIKSALNNSQQSQILSPSLMYQTPQGMMYATPSNRGLLFSLAQNNNDPNVKPQFITIPLGMMPNENKGPELDKKIN